MSLMTTGCRMVMMMMTIGHWSHDYYLPGFHGHELDDHWLQHGHDDDHQLHLSPPTEQHRFSLFFYIKGHFDKIINI